MRSSSSPILLSALLSLGLLSSAQGAAAEVVPHKALYDLTLLRANSVRGVEDVKGRIAFEGGGSACEGYTATFRQVLRMSGSEMETRLTDVRSTTFEEPGGRNFRFVIDKFLNGKEDGRAEGRTVTGNSGSVVRIAKPKANEVALPADISFPTHHTKALIEAAKAGATTHTTKTYDGSDDGRAIYETTAVIGKAIYADVAADAADAAMVKPMSGMARWPMVISYFKAGSADMNPAYTMTMELYENGVARGLRLDYGALALKGDLVTLELGKMPKCE
ncbi:MAG: cell envelope integrity EipB family protein [Beijerinckiaceae bacterium]